MSSIAIHRIAIFILVLFMLVIIPIYIDKVDGMGAQAERDIMQAVKVGIDTAERYHNITGRLPVSDQKWYENFFKIAPKNEDELRKAIEDGKL